MRCRSRKLQFDEKVGMRQCDLLVFAYCCGVWVMAVVMHDLRLVYYFMKCLLRLSNKV